MNFFNGFAPITQCRGDIDTTNSGTCIDENVQDEEVVCGLDKEVLIAYELYTRISGMVISWSSKVTISVA